MYEQDYAPEEQAEIVEEPAQETVAQEQAPKGKSIAALIFGIVSIAANLPGFPLPFAWTIALASTIVSKILLKTLPESGLQKGAKITSTIGMIMTIVWGSLAVLGIIFYIIYVILVAVLGFSIAFLPALQ